MNWTCEHPHPLPSTVTREPWPRSAGRPQRNDAGGRERTLGYDDHDDAGGGKTAIILIGLRSLPDVHTRYSGRGAFAGMFFHAARYNYGSSLALKGFRGKHVTVRCTENYHPRTR